MTETSTVSESHGRANWHAMNLALRDNPEIKSRRRLTAPPAVKANGWKGGQRTTKTFRLSLTLKILQINNSQATLKRLGLATVIQQISRGELNLEIVKVDPF